MTVVPALGGKISSFLSEVTGTEFAWQDPTRPLRPATFGGAFGEYDASGIDDCFPTVDACRYPGTPFEGVDIVDHGELWSLPWRCERIDRGLALSVEGRRLPYRIEKRIHLEGQRATFEYTVTNTGAAAFRYIWLGHPLLAMQEGTRVVIPGTPETFAVFALGGRITVDPQPQRWPDVIGSDGGAVDYSRIGPPELVANDKVFVRSPAEGWCALQHPSSTEHLRLEFSPAVLPWLGVCINHCGWPLEGRSAYWVAIEPATSRLDRLDRAITEGEARVLEPGQPVGWSWSMAVVEGIASP
jgi:hypothetical protein